MSDNEQQEETKTFDWLPEGTVALADGEYDAIVLGTGLVECIMSGLLAVNGKKVLHIDRNNFYGGDSASLNLTNLFAKFRDGAEPPASLGANRDYNVDLIPKLIMACGKLVKILLHTKVTRYLEFKNIDGSYVFKGGKTYKVPASAEEALKSSLMGMFEKRRFRKLLVYINNWDENQPKTHEGLDLKAVPMRAVYDKFGVEEGTRAFTGHAMALQTDDTYLDKPAIAVVKAIQLYAYSLERYGKSPYIYPIYGLGGLPEGFSRLCAIHGGTFMLDRPFDEVLTGDDGKAWGVKSGNEVAKAPMIIGDPSYFPQEKLQKVGRVVRSICFLNHPIAGTKDAPSTQLIIPAAQVKGKNNDIYVCCVSSSHQVCPKGLYVAIVSTEVETDDPIKEIAVALSLIEPIVERFDAVEDRLAPVGDGSADNCYISRSLDATSNFETMALDCLNMHERVFGTELDMTISADSVEE